MMERKTISLVGAKLDKDFGLCRWCSKPLKSENDIYKVRGDFVCRECVERMYEERED